MSALQVAVCVSWAAGVATGAALVAAFWRRSSPRAAQCGPDCAEAWTDDEELLLTASDRQVVAEQFAHHLAAVRRQVGAYADELAYGDAALRERLRRVEGGFSR